MHDVQYVFGNQFARQSVSSSAVTAAGSNSLGNWWESNAVNAIENNKYSIIRDHPVLLYHHHRYSPIVTECGNQTATTTSILFYLLSIHYFYVFIW